MTINLKDDDDRVHITSIQTHFRFFFQMDLHLVGSVTLCGKLVTAGREI